MWDGDGGHLTAQVAGVRHVGQKQWLLVGWIPVGGIERLDCLEFAWHGGYGAKTEPSFNIMKRELFKGPATATARTRVQELGWPPSCTKLTLRSSPGHMCSVVHCALPLVELHFLLSCVCGQM